MQPIVLLRCLAKVLVRHVGNIVGLGFAGDVLVKVGEEVFDAWEQELNENQRRAELQAIARAAAGEVRDQVEAVVREVAAGQPAAVRDAVSRCLQQVPDMVRAGWCWPGDPSGLTAPADWHIVKSEDLLRSYRRNVSRLNRRHSHPPPAKYPMRPSPPTQNRNVQGPLRGQKFEFAERTACILGRAADCQPCLPDDQAHRRIARLHCLLDINPPDIRIRDFGSMNGTYINSDLIGKRATGMTPEEGARLAFAEAIRNHWSIESMHWVLDVNFRDDDSRTRERILGNNLSWLRRFAITLLKRHPAKDSLRGKMVSCMASTAFLTEVLSLNRV